MGHILTHKIYLYTSNLTNTINIITTIRKQKTQL